MGAFVMSSKKNVWRGKSGGLQFRRETKRYSDGTPWGCDALYVRIKGKFCCVIEPFEWSDCAKGKTLSLLMGNYSAQSPIGAAHAIRERFL
jgi:hypothetical protein